MGVKSIIKRYFRSKKTIAGQKMDLMSAVFNLKKATELYAKLNTEKPHKYSDLNINVFSNSAKLIIAYKIYFSQSDICKFAEAADSMFLLYDMNFISDEKWMKLDNYKKNSKEFMECDLKARDLHHSYDIEMPGTFMNWCIQLNKNDDFFIRVYEHLGLEYTLKEIEFDIKLVQKNIVDFLHIQ